MSFFRWAVVCVLSQYAAAEAAAGSKNQDTASSYIIELIPAAEYGDNPMLDKEQGGDLSRLGIEVNAKWRYRLNPSWSFFLEASAFVQREHLYEDNDATVEKSLERGETWVYWEQPFGAPVGLQIGRQTFEDERTWWWDEDLDAFRVHYRADDWALEFTLAEETFRKSTLRDGVDPHSRDVVRAITQARWHWHEDHRVEGFLLWQDDRSPTPEPGDIVNEDEQDESDADLIYLGLRATGEYGLSEYGAVSYWADAAFVRGDELSAEFAENDDGLIEVESVRHRDVRGWAVDIGAFWTLPFEHEAALMLGYARGSGDADPGKSTDRAFRQTGLQDNKADFKYYGELFDPELSNLSVTSAGVLFPIADDAFWAFVYHRYRQVEAAPFLRDSGIDRDPDGVNKDLGQEWDLILRLDDWHGVEWEASAAMFEAGSAFGDSKGERSYRLFLELTFEF